MANQSGSFKSGATPDKRSLWLHPLAVASLLAISSVVYLKTLHPGVGSGDTADLQWAAAVWGICHSPGYALQVTALHLFTSLPLGGTIARRANLMSAVMGVVGMLLLYGAVRRVTDSVLAGWVAAGTLAFSSVYWSESLVAEVYVFGGAFIALSAYAAARAERGARPGWLLLSFLALGVAVAERPSELTILPAFLILWIGVAGREGLRPRRLLAAAVLLVLPFAVAIALDVVRDNPDGRSAHEDFITAGIPGVDMRGEVTYSYKTDRGLIGRIEEAVYHASGLVWTPRVYRSGVGLRFREIGWLVSGLGERGERFAPAGQHDPMLVGGVSVGPAGLLCALAGLLAWRRRRTWVLFALALTAGNLAFVLLYEAFDSMTFTVPSWIGLSFLAGLGCAILQSRARSAAGRRLAGGAIVVLLPVVLLAVNYPFIARDTETSRRLMERRYGVLQCNWPHDSVILLTYWPAMTFRYLLEVEAGRTDVSVIHLNDASFAPALKYFRARGRPVFGERWKFDIDRNLQKETERTPPNMRRLGLVYLGGATPA